MTVAESRAIVRTEGPRRRGEGDLLLQEILSRASCAPNTTWASLENCNRNSVEDPVMFWGRRTIDGVE